VREHRQWSQRSAHVLVAERVHVAREKAHDGVDHDQLRAALVHGVTDGLHVVGQTQQPLAVADADLLQNADLLGVAAGMSQRQAADRLGRSQSFVAKSESGERRVDVVELRQFAAAYKKPIRFFLR